MGNDTILTPIQLKDLKVELELVELDLQKARLSMESYKNTSEDRTGFNDYTVLDNSYYETISSLVMRKSEIENLLANSLVATPTGSMVQVGSIVELADRDLKFMVVQKRLTKNPSIKEVSMESPIFGAIYMHTEGDICEYSVNGKNLKCVIGKVDNEYCHEVAKSLSDSDSFDHGAITR